LDDEAATINEEEEEKFEMENKEEALFGDCDNEEVEGGSAIDDNQHDI